MIGGDDDLGVRIKRRDIIYFLVRNALQNSPPGKAVDITVAVACLTA